MSAIANEALRYADNDHERSIMMRLAAMIRRGLSDQIISGDLSDLEWLMPDSNLNTVTIRHRDLGQFEIIVTKKGD